MNKLKSALIALTFLSLIHNLTANAFIDKTVFDLKTKELIKGNSHKWIIVDGAGIGIILNSSKESESIIDSNFNKLTNAHGQIISTDKKCKGNLAYFNGSLLDLETPKSNCGFGRIIKFKEASPLLQKLSNLLLLQEKIRINFHSQKSDIDLIRKDTFKCIKELSLLVKEIKANKFEGTSHNKEGIIQNLNSAIKSNLNAIKELNFIQKGKYDKERVKQSFKELSEAYDFEIAAIKKTISRENYNK